MKTNVFYHGDCLFVMKHDIPPETIDLIYLDPPFFTGKVQKGELRHNDKRKQKTEGWEPGAMQISYDDSKAFWSNKEIQENASSWLKDLAKWSPKSHWHPFARYLYYIMERLRECENVLKPTGSIYLHCDWNASHYLKMIMDEIFGYKSFQNEIIWSYGSGGISRRRFARKHDIIFFYSKTDKYTFIEQRVPFEDKSIFKEEDERGKFVWWARPGTKSGGKEGKKVYLKDGTQMRDVWMDLSHINQMAKERTGYPTQKPKPLLKRIIDASSNKGDIILDPFCGCGTALVAAHELNRRWIGIDINKRAFEVIRDRGSQTNLDGIINAPVLIRKSKGIYEWVMSLTSKEHKVFEDWVNDFYGASKPSPDKGVDGITKDGIPIQTKIYKVGYNIVSEFLNNAKYHPDVRIRKPLKTIMLVSQKGFDESAWQMVSEINTNEGIKVELFTPKDMLGTTEDLINTRDNHKVFRLIGGQTGFMEDLIK